MSMNGNPSIQFSFGFNSSNIPVKHTFTSGRNSTATDKELKVDNPEGYVVHRINGRETVQGVALKYNVNVAEVKKLNKLWSNGEVFGKKELLIPLKVSALTEDQKKLVDKIAKQNSTQTSMAKSASGTELNEQNKNEFVSKFMETAQVDEQTSIKYLEESDFSFTRALAQFYADKQSEDPENESSTKYYNNGSSHSDNDKDVSGFHSEGDIFGGFQFAGGSSLMRKVRGNSINRRNTSSLSVNKSQSADNFGTVTYSDGPTLHKVDESVQQRFKKQEEELFDL